MADTSPIHAAGVVVLRQADDGPEVLVVHRPLRADWSLPKGKLEAGEHAIAAAVRECDEETGFTPILREPLPTQEYEVDGQPKVVRYWIASAGAEEPFTPDDEVDEIRWVPASVAADLLTYPADAALVRSAGARPETVPLIVLRHGRALKRSDFRGNDDLDRPLTGRGRSEGKALVPLLDAYGIEEIHSSDARRCVETVKRFAKSAGIPIHTEQHFNERRHEAKPQVTTRRALDLAQLDRPLVLCTHRPVLPTVIEALTESLAPDLDDDATRTALETRLTPGSFLVLHRARNGDGALRCVAVEHHTLHGA